MELLSAALIALLLISRGMGWVLKRGLYFGNGKEAK